MVYPYFDKVIVAVYLNSLCPLYRAGVLLELHIFEECSDLFDNIYQELVNRLVVDVQR